MPIAVFSVLYNVSRFFELRTVYHSYAVNVTSSAYDEGDGDGDAVSSEEVVVTVVGVERTDMRADPA